MSTDAVVDVPVTAKADSIVTKVQRTLDLQKEKIAKLVAENKRLKTQVQEIKCAHSRIRRIPKKAAEETTA